MITTANSFGWVTYGGVSAPAVQPPQDGGCGPPVTLCRLEREPPSAIACRAVSVTAESSTRAWCHPRAAWTQPDHHSVPAVSSTPCR
jgi:hypothetical protein